MYWPVKYHENIIKIEKSLLVKEMSLKKKVLKKLRREVN